MKIFIVLIFTSLISVSVSYVNYRSCIDSDNKYNQLDCYSEPYSGWYPSPVHGYPYYPVPSYLRLPFNYNRNNRLHNDPRVYPQFSTNDNQLGNNQIQTLPSKLNDFDNVNNKKNNLKNFDDTQDQNVMKILPYYDSKNRENSESSTEEYLDLLQQNVQQETTPYKTNSVENPSILTNNDPNNSNYKFNKMFLPRTASSDLSNKPDDNDDRIYFLNDDVFNSEKQPESQFSYPESSKESEFSNRIMFPDEYNSQRDELSRVISRNYPRPVNRYHVSNQKTYYPDNYNQKSNKTPKKIVTYPLYINRRGTYKKPQNPTKEKQTIKSKSTAKPLNQNKKSKTQKK